MSLADRASDVFENCGGDYVSPPILIEARVPLELSGEAVRARICTFVDENGKEWALRPDLTLVVAQAEVEARKAGGTGDCVRRYCGPVFRLPARIGEPVEYDQVGLERFGAARGVTEDVWLFETLLQASQACGVRAGHVSLGDLSIFPAFIDALALDPDLAAGLKRAFRQAGGVTAFLHGRERNQRGLTSRLSGMERGDIAAFVEDIFAMTNLRPVGERTGDEIVERLYARAASTSGLSLTAAQTRVIEQLLDLDLPLSEAPRALAEIAKQGGLSGLDGILQAFTIRTETLLSDAPSAFLSSARFATQFGRRFTYYDGFVFEIAASQQSDAVARPFVAGGRYDSLLSDLSGGAVTATALGGVIIPHRLAAVSGAAS
jgi:ATP phosphoribosyltransferase regulatory subunit